MPAPSARLPLPVARALLLLLACWAASTTAQAQAPAACEAGADTAPAGAYRTTTGALISVLPEGNAGSWRITHFNSGRSHRLHPRGGLTFQSADDFHAEHPVAWRYAFEPGAAGPAEALAITPAAGPPLRARRLALRQREAVFQHGDVTLRGRLTLPPAGRGPFPAVVLVHGSDPVPSVGREWLPHLLAPHGIATLVFDKRGTGCSQGQYVQHFGLLAGDVAAAARWLKAQPEVAPARIGLAGFSQGGWVAPLAALQEPTVRYVAVAYGLAMSLADEDRLEAPLKLKALGLDDTSVAEFEALNATLHALARSGFQDWSAFEQQLEAARQRPWLALAAQQPSWLGTTLQMGLAQAKQVAPAMFEQFFQPFYDPVPTLERLDIPMLWLVAGQDHEAPPGPTLQVLARLARQGRPVATVVFPHADHGLLDFELRSGQRVSTHYAQGYFSTLLRWLRQPGRVPAAAGRGARP